MWLKAMFRARKGSTMPLLFSLRSSGRCEDAPLKLTWFLDAFAAPACNCSAQSCCYEFYQMKAQLWPCCDCICIEMRLHAMSLGARDMHDNAVCPWHTGREIVQDTPSCRLRSLGEQAGVR